MDNSGMSFFTEKGALDAAIATLQSRVRERDAEIERLQAIIRCEQESGQCVMIHDPEREPCTRRNCHYMGVRVHQQLPSGKD